MLRLLVIEDKENIFIRNKLHETLFEFILKCFPNINILISQNNKNHLQRKTSMLLTSTCSGFHYNKIFSTNIYFFSNDKRIIEAHFNSMLRFFL